MIVQFFVAGVPAPQGSKTRNRYGGVREDNPNTKPWRHAITYGARNHGHTFPVDIPLLVDLEFRFARPKSHYRTGRFAGDLKQTAPTLKTSAPDIDKLARSVLDALTASGMWRDDSQVARLLCAKTYGDDPGVNVMVRTLEP